MSLFTQGSPVTGRKTQNTPFDQVGPAQAGRHRPRFCWQSNGVEDNEYVPHKKYERCSPPGHLGHRCRSPRTVGPNAGAAEPVLRLYRSGVQQSASTGLGPPRIQFFLDWPW